MNSMTGDDRRRQTTADDGRLRPNADVVSRRLSSSLVVLFGAVLLAPAPDSPAPTDNPGVQVLLADMRAAYARIHMARVRFTEDRPEWSTPAHGIVEWAGGGRLLAKFAVPEGGFRTIRTNGYKIVTEGAGIHSRDVKPYAADALRGVMPGDLSIAALYDWPRLLAQTSPSLLAGAVSVQTDVEWDGRRWTVLKEIRDDEIVRVLIDPTTHLIWRTERIDRSTGELTSAVTVEQIRIRHRPQALRIGAGVMQAEP